MVAKKVLVGLMLALAVSGPAWAQAKSDWAQTPTGADFVRYYPKVAADQGVAGRAILDCDVTAAGSLERCRVVEETPLGYGFGEAALKLTGLFRMNAKSVDPSDPARRRNIVPIIFGFAGSPLPAQGYLVGQGAWMMKAGVKKGARGARPCPEEGKPEQLCTDHAIVWAKQPSLQDTLPALDGVDMDAGTSVLLCEPAADGTLTGCLTTPEATPAARKAMLALASLFVAPRRAQDGDAIAGGQVAIPFDWSKITPLARKLKRP
ncbi:energy transducer TonB [Caulobacter segnis]|uniref:energy transducer TonB n=1 Tax=Caulobacter segnis TaxID=88688 RepID=UPI001CBC3548|nr:energy transducer TonB [Caulobacter segnis]UAL10596.1 energy transducer TonB [Caulobacter segnis]